MGSDERGSRPTWDVAFVGFVLGHGGDALQMLTLARGVQALGARVRVIVPELPSSEGFAARCRDVGLPCERSARIRASMQGSRQHVRGLMGLFRSLDASIVHYHTGNSCLPRTALLSMALLRMPPGFVTVQSPYETIHPRSLQARMWAYAVDHHVECVVSPSEHGRRFQASCGVDPARLATIHNSFDASMVEGGDPAAPRRLLRMRPDEPLVLFFSRLDPQKRPLDALDAFVRIAHQHPDARLAFAGIGSERDVIEAAAQRFGLADRVHLVGYQHNVADWLAAATVWILPTERENLSVAVLEALAAGCPVLSTLCPGNDEILNDCNAVTFDVGDVANASRGLDLLLRDASLRARLADAGRRTAGGYTDAGMVDEYRSLYTRSALAPAVLRG